MHVGFMPLNFGNYPCINICAVVGFVHVLGWVGTWAKSASVLPPVMGETDTQTSEEQ